MDGGWDDGVTRSSKAGSPGLQKWRVIHYVTLLEVAMSGGRIPTYLPTVAVTMRSSD